MRCPNDGSRLVEVERADVLVDACPTCRGVWLDRGELDKILVRERELMKGGAADDDFFAEVQGQRPSTPAPRRDDRPRDDDRSDYDKYKKRKRRKSLLEELLDF